MPNRPIRSKINVLSQVALACYCVALFVATHVSPTTVFLQAEENNFDKVFHFVAYAVLAGLLATVWQLNAGVLTLGHLRWVWIVTIVLGALDEITQIPVNRDCNIWDWSADALGAIVGLLIFAWVRRSIAVLAAKQEPPP
jgi:VanZ family protein